MIKFWQIWIDGPDKTGKDLLFNYINILGKYKYSPQYRGIVTQLVYNEKYNRNYHYNIDDTLTKNSIYVYLTCDDEEMLLRCKLNGEDGTQYLDDKKLFDKYFDLLEKENYHIFRYNTSHMSFYDITNDLLKKIEEMEK